MISSTRTISSRLFVFVILVGLVFASPLAGLLLAQTGDSPKGQWGRLTAIADNNHPNLYYNQSEIDELRNMILVQHSPQHLYDLYNSQMKGVLAVSTAPSMYQKYRTDLKASISYMIEPTSLKADAIRAALFSYMNAYPSFLPDWSGSSNFAGYGVPWMFDLLMAYNPEKLSSAEVTSLKKWFAVSAENLKFNSRNPRAITPSGLVDPPPPVLREGQLKDGFPNWYSRYMGPALAMALVSGNQSDVDYFGDSGWPHDLFTFNGLTSTYPSAAANRYDLVTYLLAVYPSGANSDSYERELYATKVFGVPLLPNSLWYTVDYTWGAYHFAQMYGPILGAEMAYHNGMTGVFGITDVPGTEPALLRTYKRAIQSRTEMDSQPANPTTHPIIGWDPAIFAGYRRYSDPAIDNAIPGILSYSGPIPVGIGDSYRGYDVPGEVWQFFGYPRRAAWTGGSAVPPTPPPPAPTPTPAPPTGDITPPVISSISITNITSSTATVNWKTDEPANGQVEFLTSCFSTGGCESPLDSTLTTSHIYTISNIAPNTFYTVQIRSSDAAGNLAISPNQVFITLTGGDPAPVPAPTPTPIAAPGATTLFPPTAVPSQSQSNASPVELGVRFRSDVSGSIAGIRFYKGPTDTGVHTGSLWSPAGQLLATGVFTETATGWQQLNFAAPVTITPNTTYTASYHTSSAFFYDSNYFQNQGVDNPPLHVLKSGVDGPSGVYIYGPGGVAPNQTYQQANYWVDVVLSLSATIFPATAKPAQSQSNASPVELSVKFRSSVTGAITGIRFYKTLTDTSIHTGSLWSSTGQLLATGTFVNETASGWQQLNFTAPVIIAANKSYIASYHTSGAFFYDYYFQSGSLDNPPLEALKDGDDGPNGLYVYGPGGVFPSQTYQSTNYWVDVVFSH